MPYSCYIFFIEWIGATRCRKRYPLHYHSKGNNYVLLWKIIHTYPMITYVKIEARCIVKLRIQRCSDALRNFSKTRVINIMSWRNHGWYERVCMTDKMLLRQFFPPNRHSIITALVHYYSLGLDASHESLEQFFLITSVSHMSPYGAGEILIIWFHLLTSCISVMSPYEMSSVVYVIFFNIANTLLFATSGNKVIRREY